MKQGKVNFSQEQDAFTDFQYLSNLLGWKLGSRSRSRSGSLVDGDTCLWDDANIGVQVVKVFVESTVDVSPPEFHRDGPISNIWKWGVPSYFLNIYFNMCLIYFLFISYLFTLMSVSYSFIQIFIYYLFLFYLLKCSFLIYLFEYLFLISYLFIWIFIYYFLFISNFLLINSNIDFLLISYWFIIYLLFIYLNIFEIIILQQWSSDCSRYWVRYFATDHWQEKVSCWKMVPLGHR